MNGKRERELTRRTALRLAGTAVAGSTVALAGCSDAGDQEDGATDSDGADGGEEENETDGADGGGEDGTNESADGDEDENETDGEAENETNGSDGGEGGNTIELGAETSGWVGQSPPDIEGEMNPPLSLEPGTAYELTWENLDGVEHELVVEDENGEELEASDSAEEEGETVTMEFEATEEMAEYYCEYHPDSMRGDITTGGE